jgi:Tfp pilus assembly protein PilX
MVFLVLFAVLAVGFAECEIMNAQVSRNEKCQQQAMSSAESGLAFARYQFGKFSLPAGTDSTNLLANAAARLGATLNGSSNMGGGTVSITAGTIYIPSATGWVTTDATTRARFRISIAQSGNNLVVTSRGTAGDGTLARAVQVQFVREPKPYALAGVSSVSLSGGAFTDSWDPDDPDPTKRVYSSTKAYAGGTVASNGNITLTNTAKVNGDVRYGVAATASIAPSAKVTGVVSSLRKPVSFPSVTLPATYTDLGDVTMSSGTQHIPGGTYVINNLNLSGTANIIWDGPVKLYIKSSYSVTQNVTISTYGNRAINRQLYFLPTCATATWSGTNVCVGDLYAPDTAFTISGSVEKFGRVIAKSITNNSTKGMHYDQSLPSPEFNIIYSADMDTYLEVL